MNKEKAQLIVTRHYHYNGTNAGKEFQSLRGDLRGPVAREAAFQVKTLLQTDGFSELLLPESGKEATAEDKSQLLFDAFCEYYAHQGNQELLLSGGLRSHTFETLKAKSDRAFEFESGMPRQQRDFILENNLDPTTLQAKQNNQRIQRQKAEGKEVNPAQELQQLMDRLTSFSR